MKLPKLKYLCTALTPEQYQEFERTRTIEVTGVSINPVSGQATGRAVIPMVLGSAACDTYFRMQLRSWGPLLVLRFPVSLLDRRAVQVIDPRGIFEYRASLHIPHCGVERFEIDQAHTAQQPQVIGHGVPTT